MGTLGPAREKVCAAGRHQARGPRGFLAGVIQVRQARSLRIGVFLGAAVSESHQASRAESHLWKSPFLGGERLLLRRGHALPCQHAARPARGLAGRLRCHPVCRAMLENQGRLMALAGREGLGKHVPVLAVNGNYLWSTLNSPRVLERPHNGQIQPLVRSAGSRKPFPQALMGAGPSPTALMTSP